MTGNFKETGIKDVSWTDMVQNMSQWWVFVVKLMNFQDT
jgi:hypothetical protein